MFKWFIGGARAMLVVALIVGVSACAINKQPPIPENPDEITVAILPYISYAPFIIAQEEGYYAEQGLAVEFVEFTRTAELVPALASGQLDVAAGLLTAGTLNAIAREGQIRYVADKGFTDPASCTYTTFMARSDLLETGQLDTPAGLAGTRIALSGASSAEYYLDVLLEMGGLTPDQVEIVEVPLPIRLEGMMSGELDLAVVSEPWGTRISDTGSGEIWMPMEEVLPDFQLSVILYGKTFLEDESGLGTRFMIAYLKAVEQYQQGKTTRNLEIMSEFTGLDEELLERACWQSFRLDGTINLQSVIDFQKWADSRGLLDIELNPEDFWDPQYIEAARRVLEQGG
jgi:NitT/TauT family transport system substrate-binding protein